MWTVRWTRRAGGYDVSIFKWRGRANDVLTILFVVVGVALDFLTWGLVGWSDGDAEPRWLVRVHDRRTGETRTVYAPFTGVGARIAAGRVDRRLRDAEPDAFEELPDIEVWNGPVDPVSWDGGSL